MQRVVVIAVVRGKRNGALVCPTNLSRASGAACSSLRLLLLARTHARMHARMYVCMYTHAEKRAGLLGRTAETSFSNSFVTSVRGCYAPRIRSAESGNEAERIIRNLHDARDEAGMRDGSGRKKSVTTLIVIGTYICMWNYGLIPRYIAGVIFSRGHVRWEHSC